MTPLEAQFHEAMLNSYTTARNQLHYNATYFLRMIEEQGGVEAARSLLHSSHFPHDGFTALWERGRLDITAEALVLKARFHGLFSEEVHDEARRRLEEYQWQPPANW